MPRRQSARFVPHVLGIAALLAAALVPVTGAAATGQRGTHGPQALPAHSQRPVCGPPAAGSAMCHAHVVTHAHSPAPLASTSYQYGYAPSDLAKAYALPAATGDPGSGPRVAIVDAYDNPSAEQDLLAYRQEFKQPRCSDGGVSCLFTKVDQSGGTTSYPKGDTGWGAEIDLDIEMVSAACPTCRILLVEADSSSFSDLMAAVDQAVAQGATFVSNSYGSNEFGSETGYDSHFTGGAAFTASSGDSGYGAEYPAASPYVTAVGGTSLSTASNARGWSETAWSGAGSGCSSYEPKPGWQHDTGCSRRTVADVSAVADPNTGVAVYDSYGSSNGANWYVYGGTSVAAPFVAGAWANAQATSSETLPRSPETPYANATGWFDVVGGQNTHHCRDGYLCQAVTGYDGPTGLGTPNGDAGFIGGSSGGGGTANQPPTASFTDSCIGLTCQFADDSSDSDGSIVDWGWTFGDGGTWGGQTPPDHTYSTSGTYQVTLTVRDDGGTTSSTTEAVTVSSGSTSALTLSASGYKNRGKDTVDLSWAPTTTTVDIYRDGTTVATNQTGGSYTDNTGQRGSATYEYKVCDTTSGACSSPVTVTF